MKTSTDQLKTENSIHIIWIDQTLHHCKGSSLNQQLK